MSLARNHGVTGSFLRLGMFWWLFPKFHFFLVFNLCGKSNLCGNPWSNG